jgi:uncharacterized membrane protein
MDKHVFVFADVFLFAFIAGAAAVFGFSHADHQAMLVGRGVCAVSASLAVLSITTKRSQSV